ncbi:hypothetical protein ASPWEDRAFT_44852 [Aspergillus wentii DTO 134E9]|uniref:glutathione transferase n=1 Tax=Aspergillus wentii DTO 134E9 TaxID=1073089 RepID=A0A1L9R7H6_ASPWE|nr:uncharacterized protein ASPWEDRAFT_44852 [Aspergillus wentii DTO 134E9]KAI9927497.1 hypothetical protein MW887_003113 [Aspergillus wentii]OJJ30872.1 hypothetical protein ASPWEDRAFT_44852 [Aspergillus wentii DTO 134E9]
MTLTVHHLKRSQSERIIWLCEELNIPYELKVYAREPTLSAPEPYRNIHWSGTAPVIQDGELALAESGAIVEYILSKYGNGKLVIKPDQPNYADYLFWFHHANGSVQPTITTMVFAEFAKISPDDPGQLIMRNRFQIGLSGMDKRLGEFEYLAGNELTGADIMMVFSLTTMRLFLPYSLEEFPNIMAYLDRVGKREAYQRAMKKGDPDLRPVLDGIPQDTFF